MDVQSFTLWTCLLRVGSHVLLLSIFVLSHAHNLPFLLLMIKPYGTIWFLNRPVKAIIVVSTNITRTYKTHVRIEIQHNLDLIFTSNERNFFLVTFI